MQTRTNRHLVHAALVLALDDELLSHIAESVRHGICGHMLQRESHGCRL